MPGFGIEPPKFQLPSDLRLGPVRLAVYDVMESIAWYERTLGLTTITQEGHTALLAAQGATEPLLELEQQASIDIRSRGARRLGLYHYAFLLPDRRHLGSFLSHIASQREPVGTADHGVSEAVYLQDPDGLGIEVYADRSADTWKTDGRQLEMTTLPLDLNALTTAGRGTPWTGMPHGTVIGHVHLHVGNLSESDVFYHQAFGFTRTVWGYPGASFLAAGGYHHHLGTNTWAHGAPTAGPADPRLLHWTVKVTRNDTLTALAENLEAHARSFTREDDRLVSHDPWGTTVHVVKSEA